jgi:DNA polymerase-3 subunit delta'
VVKAPFPGVVGHEYARQGLWRALVEGRLHHALLIQGLQGVGKRTVAETVARTLLCDSRDLGPCERCTHCRRAAEGLHPDLVVIGRDQIFGIDEELIAHRDDRVSKRKEPVGKVIDVDYMRVLGVWLSKGSWEASRRVAVVVDAERMNVNGANAFLKSLEEPAPGAVVILTSSSPAFLRPTIRSRCATLRLSGVPQGLIEKRLIEQGVAAHEARVRAQTSAGSLSRALQTRPSLDDLRDQLLLRFQGGKAAEVAAFLASSMASAKDVDRDHTLHLFATLLRDIAVLQQGGDAPLINDPVADALARVASGRIDPQTLFDRVVEARGRIAGQANRTILWDDLLHDATSGV